MIRSFYIATRQRTEQLCVPLTTEDYVPQVVEFASPPKWHLAHTSWFFEKMILQEYLPDYRVFDPIFGTLFNSYYQSAGLPFARHQRGAITRPGVDEIYAYRAHVDKHILLLMEAELAADVIDLLELGCQHEQQHQELLITDLKLMLAYNPMEPVYSSEFDEGATTHVASPKWLEFADADVHIGHLGDGFCFDNERACHRVHVAEFAICDQLVSNGEYLEFIEDGGYKKFEYWLDEAWHWVNSENVAHPLYWQLEDRGWTHFTLAGRKALDPKAALTHISFYEAQAFATWKGCRLPTEFEWESASQFFNWGQHWEWTASAYQAYPGFEIGPGAVGEYNGKFMVNQMVLRGGSLATAKGHSRATYRNFFHPHHQWQYSGIRLAK